MNTEEYNEEICKKNAYMTHKLIYEYMSMKEKPYINLSEFLSRRMNRRYDEIYKMFSYIFGVTPFEHFRRIRIETMKEMMWKNPSLQLIDFVDLLHFSNPSHVRTEFIKHEGENPIEFKKRILGKLKNTAR